MIYIESILILALSLLAAFGLIAVGYVTLVFCAALAVVYFTVAVFRALYVSLKEKFNNLSQDNEYL